MTIEMVIDHETCTKCGLCYEICPVQAFSWQKGEFPERNAARQEICMACGQCMAICPGKAVIIGQMDYERDFTPLDRETPDYPAFMSLAASRRSIRNFKDKSVPRDLLEKVVEAIALAPMGFPPHKTRLTVVQERSSIEQMLPLMIDFYEQMLGWYRNPVKRYFMKRDAGTEAFATIEGHLIPILQAKLPDMKKGVGKGGRDEITRGAPALILLHAPRRAENHTQDANIALAYGLLAAHSLGLGATAISLIPPVVNHSSELKRILKLDDAEEVVASIIVGYPRYRFQRGIKRELAGVNWFQAPVQESNS